MATQTYYAYANGGSLQIYRGKVVLTETVDVANNSSKIDYAFYLYRSDGYTGPAHSFNYGNVLVVTINGTTLINSSNYKSVVLTGTSESSPFVMCSGSVTIPHNSDGTKSFEFSFAYSQSQSQASLKTLTVSGTHACTQIARASSVSAPSTCAFGAAAKITISAASSTFTHNLRYEIGSKTGTIKNNASTETSWTIPNSLMSELPNTTQGVMTIYCDTYLNGTKIGTKSTTMAVTVPASVVPTLSVAISEAASIPSGISGYIQQKSRLKVVSTAAGVYGSGVKTCVVTVDGAQYSGTSITTNVIGHYGTLTVSVTVVDTRGRSTTKKVDITVVQYIQPMLSGITAYRCKSATDPTADSAGEYICVKPRGSITPLNNQNAKTCTVYYRASTASGYTSKSLTMGDYTLDTEYVIFAAPGINSYLIYVNLKDSFTTVRADAPTVSTVGRKIHLPKKKNRIGIGKVAEVDGVDVGWDVYLRKTLLVEGYLINGQSKRCSYIFKCDTGTAGKWVCLGRLKIGVDSWSTMIDLYTGDGYNGNSSQNTLISIFIKDAWQSTKSDKNAFGVSYEVKHYDDSSVTVRAMATSSDEVLIWVKIPWAYANGYYEVHGLYQTWSHINQIQDAEPSTGTAQQVTKY